ncbi:MAG: sigma-70 family RNA polymerase sigma factor [Gemmatimonadales bacterium]
MTHDPGTITTLLSQWSDGDESAFPKLVEIAYDDLRAIAHRRLRVGSGDGLTTTALVHEAYLKLVGYQAGQWEGRAHFFGFASRAMRHILVDHARREHAARRGGNAIRIPFEEGAIAADDGSADILGVDESIEHLAVRNPRMARVVELRFFGGLSVPEVAEVLDTSPRTVEREWTRAKAYLLEILQDQGPP